MIRTVIHLLLVAAIAFCPTVCGPGLCASSGQWSVPCDDLAECKHSCDEEDSHEHPDHHPSSPSDHAPCDGAPCEHAPCNGGCQCICGGATVSDSAELDTLLRLPPSPDLMVAPAGEADLRATHRPGPDHTAPGDDSAPSGRAIRCMHCSLLC